MSESEMQAELERLRAENAQLKSKDKGGLTLKVSEKGGVSLYGMGRFPVTLYKEQWLRILASAPEIEAFIGVQIAICCPRPSKARAGAYTPSPSRSGTNMASTSG
jgi:hypothetical protein